MKSNRHIHTFLILACVAFISSASVAETFDQRSTAEGIDTTVAGIFGFAPGKAMGDGHQYRARGIGCPTCRLVGFERELITGDVAHYRLEIQVGPSELDRIGIHRVVRERAPYRPIRTRQAAFLAHGINVGFRGTFLASLGPEGLDPAHNLPVFLAQRNVDVWGIDFRWILVPSDAEDISELADWGLEQDAADLGLGLAIARWGRLLSGNGGRKIDLVGYSRGGRISYVYLNDETELPRWRRQVGRFVQLDAVFKATSEAQQQAACDLVDVVQAEIDGGNVADDIQVLGLVGQLATAAPDDPSPVLSGFTNRQVALIFGTLPPGGSGTFHAFGGVFEGGFPVGLRFSQEAAALNLLSSTAAYQPLAGFRDLLIVRCDDGRSELDDHLADITVPVLYIGAAGGNGDGGTATFPFLGSSVLESFVLAFEPPGQELLDVGHIDLVTMDLGDELVWQPIYEWVTAP